MEVFLARLGKVKSAVLVCKMAAICKSVRFGNGNGIFLHLLYAFFWLAIEKPQV